MGRGAEWREAAGGGGPAVISMVERAVIGDALWAGARRADWREMARGRGRGRGVRRGEWDLAS